MTALSLSVPIVPSVLASSNSGPGGDDDDRDERPSGQITTQDPSIITTAITIPVDAESHSAENPYSPNPAAVSSGSTVTWTNVDEDRHSATADDGSFSTGILDPGASGQAVINAEPGATISYHCDVHPEMRGILQISAAAGGNALAGNATAAPPQPPGQNSTLLQISEQQLAVGHYTTVSENVVNNTIQLAIAGNTTITLPNSTETITTIDSGNVTITFTESGIGILEAQVYMTTEDRLENATVTVTEFFSSENAPGRGIASFSTDSTGRLAPLDSIVAVTLDEDQPDGSAQVSFFEWHAGPFIDNNQPEAPVNNAGNVTGGNQTTPTDNQTAAITPAPAASPSGGDSGSSSSSSSSSSSTIDVSITPGSSSKTDNAYDPNPVQASVGSTVRWTNDDTT
ncbi:MAG: hypothetical protein AB1351_11535, partial [Thermoproteota archaeon]